MTRYLIAGGTGMLGTDLASALDGRDVTVAGSDQLDIRDLESVLEMAEGHDVVINAAAYTRVDDAETHEDAAYAINALGARNLARAAASNGAMLVQVSTDYVFNGTASTPYQEDSPRDPVSAYGRTKAEGERLAVLANPGATHIVRTAWLYGAHGGNFAKTMLRLAAERQTIPVVVDQVGQPTWTMDVAAMIVTLLDSGAPAGIFHATNSGQANWNEFARAIFSAAGLDPDRILRSSSADFARPAPRPAYSVLGHAGWTRFGLPEPAPWTDALERAVRAGALDIGSKA
jgi:dTDP-4-dehydrorhamnose reductase